LKASGLSPCTKEEFTIRLIDAIGQVGPKKISQYSSVNVTQNTNINTRPLSELSDELKRNQDLLGASVTADHISEIEAIKAMIKAGQVDQAENRLDIAWAGFKDLVDTSSKFSKIMEFVDRISDMF
jgi:hypothetical protein